MTTRYIPHIIYTLAITSLSTHLLNQRKESEEQQIHTKTYISLLESTITKLKSGERIDEKEYQRVKKFGKDLEDLENERNVARGIHVDLKGVGGSGMGWTEVLLGRKEVQSGSDSTSPDANNTNEGPELRRTVPAIQRDEHGHSEWERRDLEKLRQEFEAAFKTEESSSSSSS
ncbi:hypothetical protein C8Q75DRAFT_809018 [Abortiporus biennis]|nr:hypothetical protein C8Q75DRAFT_809018 [Abortiporus biennis]